MSEHADGSESGAKRLPLARRLRVSILEMMLLVAALAVSFRWPGLTVPVGLLFLYTLVRRRDILRRQTRVALGQIALALYFPPVLAFLALHFWGSFGSPDWRQYWAFVGRDYFLGFFIGRLSLMPAVLPGFLIMVTFRWGGAAVWSDGCRQGRAVRPVNDHPGHDRRAWCARKTRTRLADSLPHRRFGDVGAVDVVRVCLIHCGCVNARATTTAQERVITISISPSLIAVRLADATDSLGTAISQVTNAMSQSHAQRTS